MSKIEDLERLQHLKETGALTDEEFEKEKRQILNDTEEQTIVEKEGKVIIYSYEGIFLIAPKINVYIDGKLINILSKGQKFEYSISKISTITFKIGRKTTNVTVNPNAITEIKLIYNKFKGNFEPIYNEQNFSGINNYMNQQLYQKKIESQKRSNKIFLAIIIIGLIVGIYLSAIGEQMVRRNTDYNAGRRSAIESLKD